MRRAITIQQELTGINLIEDITEVFESIASLRISRIRNRVITSKGFFAELWQTYSGLRIDPKERLQRAHQRNKGRNVFVAITSEGKLSGSIDEQIIDALQSAYQTPATTDIVVIGTHGGSLLRQRGLTVAHLFHMPQSDVSFNVSGIIEILNAYDQITVFYQTYESLRVQKLGRIELLSAVRDLSEDVSDTSETVSSRDYIFEPGITEIADYMESVMMGVALIQVIMESKLAQYASRFNAMSIAKHSASDLAGDYRHQLAQARRGERDERLKETIKVLRHIRAREEVAA